ncbi:MAG: glutamine amidotransferase [Geminicoccales bacterium]
MKPFLVLQLRPETKASDNEFEAILRKGGLHNSETRRIRLDQVPIPADLELRRYAGVIIGGGPGCVSDLDNQKSPIERRIESAVLDMMPSITEADFPFLGCCYGIGILAHHLGGRVGKDRYSEEVGAVACHLTPEGQMDPLLNGLPERFQAFVGHKEALQELPDGCIHLLSSQPCPYQMIRYKSNVYATQFHPEADGDVFELRIRMYKDNGYFSPGDAEKLIRICRDEDVHIPERILKNYVDAYR